MCVDLAAVGLEVVNQNRSTDGSVTAQSTIHSSNHNKCGPGPIPSFSTPYIVFSCLSTAYSHTVYLEGCSSPSSRNSLSRPPPYSGNTQSHTMVAIILMFDANGGACPLKSVRGGSTPSGLNFGPDCSRTTDTPIPSVLAHCLTILLSFRPSILPTLGFLLSTRAVHTSTVRQCHRY